MAEPECWWVIVPMKDTRRAKSRLLLGAPGRRRQLAIVMARDTLCAATNAVLVDGVVDDAVVVVCEREEDVESLSVPGVSIVVREGMTLDEAVAAGSAVVRTGPTPHATWR